MGHHEIREVLLSASYRFSPRLPGHLCPQGFYILSTYCQQRVQAQCALVSAYSSSSIQALASEACFVNDSALDIFKTCWIQHVLSLVQASPSSSAALARKAAPRRRLRSLRSSRALVSSMTLPSSTLRYPPAAVVSLCCLIQSLILQVTCSDCSAGWEFSRQIHQRAGNVYD